MVRCGEQYTGSAKKSLGLGQMTTKVYSKILWIKAIPEKNVFMNITVQIDIVA